MEQTGGEEMLTQSGVNPSCGAKRGSQVEDISCKFLSDAASVLLGRPGLLLVGFQAKMGPWGGKQCGLSGQTIKVLIWTEAWS